MSTMTLLRLSIGFVTVGFLLLAFLEAPRTIASTIGTDDISKSFIVAVDIGHSKADPGATSARGIPEHEFNRKLAYDVVTALLDAGFGNSFLVNPNGDLSGSEGFRIRAKQMREGKANLSISIHHDSVQEQYLKTWSPEGKKARYSDHFSGFSIFFSRNNSNAAESFQFARILGDNLLAKGLQPSLHHAENITGERREVVDKLRGIYVADFFMVQAPTVPAVLLEAGIIVNRDEELNLLRPDFRKRIATAVANAVRHFSRIMADKHP